MQPRETDIFCEDCKLVQCPKPGDLGIGHKNEARSFLLSFFGFFCSVRHFEVFSQGVFWLHSTKREGSPSAHWSEILWPRAKKNYIITKHMYSRQFAFWIVHDCLFVVVLILDPVWSIWSWFKMKCFSCITAWDNNYLFCSRTRLWIVLALKWINRQWEQPYFIGYISITVVDLRVLVATNSSVDSLKCCF